MQYRKINTLLGWLCFAIASISYILTLEPSVSFWDCGEFIACAYRLQVAHEPGYPVFAMLGKAFSLLSMGNNAKVPYFTNMGSALASGSTIMLLFWSITALCRKLIAYKGEEDADQSKVYLIMGAGLVGALAFAYTDTFWFSAVETIVFAWSSFCTALVFWAILKWDAHADDPGADKWIVFIAYVIGLSIGIHLLNLLTIPALALVYYLRRTQRITLKNALLAILTGIVILVFVQYGIRNYTVIGIAYFDLFFVNTLGMGFGSGAAVFIVLLIALLIAGLYYTTKYKKPMLNLAFLCCTFIYLGYSSFAYIPIRATANTDLDNNHPDNAFILNSYLNREQYGETPLLYGPYFDAKAIDQTDGATIYRKGKTQYEVAGKKQKLIYDHNTILPRMYITQGDQDYASAVQFYTSWLNLPQGQSPTFGDNLKFLFSWQIYQMYWRYFFWNFVGRYNDAEGMASMTSIDGNWTSGIFDGSKHLPKSVIGGDPSRPLEGVTYTPLFALPLIIGLFGLIYHFNRRKEDALVVTLLWFFTGIAIVLYVNQPNIQPRERDYSYVGSFYAFAIWIGIGVVAIADVLRKKLSAKVAAFAATAVCLLAGPVVLAKEEWKDHDRSTKMVPHDMAYNYLNSCPKNAILFCYGDNDTYSLWYDQEVEGIRPDVRIVNLSLFSGSWYIRQMTRKMNESAPLPITMPYEKYEDGVRDVIYFDDRKIPGYTELSDVFDFITSDNPATMAQYQNGESANYLPTKNFKITINKDEVIKSGVVPDSDRARLTDTLKFKFPPNYVTKENLAMIDILAHNHWKRPICFTSTVGDENMIGLEPYLYKEGFAYHLIPFTPDTTLKNQRENVNAMVMYDNVMNKFKWGNFKTAKYLDHEAKFMSYTSLLSAFLDLTQALTAQKRPDLALKVLAKYDQELPDLNPYIQIEGKKLYLAQAAYRLNDVVIGNKISKDIDDYLTDQLDYNYYLLQNNSGQIDPETIEIGVQVLGGLAQFTKDGHQNELSDKYAAQYKDYAGKFASVLSQAQR
ncbi:glycosyltransferase family 117 protein [Mucilaginibacter sp.]